MNDPRPENPGRWESRADDLVAELGMESGGPTPQRLEDLVRAHPELEPELRSAYLRWQEGVTSLRRHGRALAPEPGRGRAVPATLGGYAVVREMGSGGMGVVYEALDPALRRRVAIKVIADSASLSPRARERFDREAATLARLRHPNIVSVYAVGEEDSRPYVVMSLVEGRPWSSALPGSSEPGAAARESIVRIGAVVARALDAAHEAGVVHRDVKPSNVVVDARGEPVLVDFGLARDAEDAGLTRTGEFVGTLAYTAPEQARGERVDARADVFSLGASLVHLLTGAPLWRARSPSELLRELATGPALDVRGLERIGGRDLATVLAKAVAERPQDRYASARDLAEDLEAVLARRPIAARRPSLPERCVHWMRRRPTAAVGLLAGIAVVVLAGALTTREVQAARREQRAAAERDFRNGILAGQILLVSDVGDAAAEFDRERAEAQLRRALAVRPDSVEARLLLAEVLTRQQRNEEARGVLADAAELGPQGFAWRFLARQTGHLPREDEDLVRASDARTWKPWPAIDRFYLAHVHYQKARRGQTELYRDAHEILTSVEMLRDPLLSPEALLAATLHGCALLESDEVEPVFGDRARAARAALDAMEALLRRAPENRTYEANRLLLISDSHNAGLDLGVDSQVLLGELAAYARGRLEEDPDDVEAAGFLARLGWQLRGTCPDVLADAAASLAGRSVDEFLELDEVHRIYGAQALAVANEHEALLAVLEEWPFLAVVGDTVPAAGPLDALVRAHEHYVRGGAAASDLQDLHVVLEGVDAGRFAAEDIAAARRRLEGLREFESE